LLSVEEGACQQDDEPQVAKGIRHEVLPSTVRKPVQAVVVRPKEGKVTLLARRFYNVLIRHAQFSPRKQGGYYEITFSKLREDSRYTSRNLEQITEALNTMLSTVVNWGDSPKNMTGSQYRWSGGTLLAFASIVKNPGEPTKLFYDFHKEIEENILNPRVYALISLDVNANLKTHAALTLYEVGVRYLTNKNGLSLKLPWREWAVILTGNPDAGGPNQQYKYFARDVLKPAIAEVNRAQNDFEIEAVVETVARKVEFLQFVVTRRENPAVPAWTQATAEAQTQQLALLGRAIAVKVPQKTAEELLLKYGATQFEAALAILEDRVQAEGKPVVAMPARYLRSLLEKGELPTPVEPPVIPVEKRVQKQKEEEGAKRFRRQYLAYVRNEAKGLFLEAPRADQEALLEAFEKERLPNLSEPIKRAWQKFRSEWPQKPMNPFVEVPFLEWLARDNLNPSNEELLEWVAQHIEHLK
jgi:hypothetical protein